MPPITQQNLSQIQTQISRQQNMINQMRKSGVSSQSYAHIQKAVSQMEKVYKQMQKVYSKQTVKSPKRTISKKTIPKKTAPRKTTSKSTSKPFTAGPMQRATPKKPAISISKIQKTMTQIDKMRRSAPPAVRKQLDKQYSMLQKMQSQVKPKKVSYDFVGPVKPGVKRETKAEYQSRVTKKPVTIKKQIETLERIKKFVPESAKKQLEKVIIARKQMIPKPVSKIVPKAVPRPVPRPVPKVGAPPAKVKIPTKIEERLLHSANPIQRALGEIVQKKRMGIAVNPADDIRKVIKKHRIMTGSPVTIAEEVGVELSDSAKNIPKVTTPAQAIKNLERVKTSLENAKKIAEGKGTPKQLEAINKMLTFIDKPLTHMKNMENTITAQKTELVGPVAPILTETDLKQKEIEKNYGNLTRNDIIGTLQSNVIDTTAQESAVADYIKLYGRDVEIELTDGTKMSASDYQNLVKSGKSDMKSNLDTWTEPIYDEKGSKIYGGEYVALGLEGEFYGVASELGMKNITQEEAEAMLYNMKTKKLREMPEEDAKRWYKNWGQWNTDSGDLMGWSEFKEKDPAVCLSRDKQGNMKVDYDYNKWYGEYKSTMGPLAQGAHDLAGFIMGGITDEDYMAPLIFERDLEKAQQSSSKWVYGVATAGQRGDIIGGATGLVQSGVFENIILPAVTAGTFSVMGKAGTKLATWGAGRVGTSLLGKGISKAAVLGGKVMASKVTPYVIGGTFMTHMGTQLGVTAALEKKLDDVKKAPPGSRITWMGETYKKEDLLDKLEREGMPTIGFGEIATGIATGAPVKGPGWITYGGGAPETYVGATRKQILKLGMQMPAFIAGTRLPQSLGRMRVGWKAYKAGPDAWTKFRAMPEGHPIQMAKAEWQAWKAKLAVNKQGLKIDPNTHRVIQDPYKFRKMNSSQAKAAYRRLSKQCHSDRGGSDAAFKILNESYEVYGGGHPVVGIKEKISFKDLKTRLDTWTTGFKKTFTPKTKPFKSISRERAMVEWVSPKGVSYPVGKVALESGHHIGDLPEVWTGVKSPITGPSSVGTQTTLEQFGLREAGPRITTLAEGEYIAPSWKEIQVMKSQAPTGKDIKFVRPKAKGFTTLEKYGLDVGLQIKQTPKGVLLESQQPYKVVEGEGLGVSRHPTYAEAQLARVKTPTQITEKLSITTQQTLPKTFKRPSEPYAPSVSSSLPKPTTPRSRGKRSVYSKRKMREMERRIQKRSERIAERKAKGRVKKEDVKIDTKIDVIKPTTKKIVEFGTFKTPEGELIPYKTTYPDPRMKNIWKHKPSGELISREGTVSVLKEPISVLKEPTTKTTHRALTKRIIKKAKTHMTRRELIQQKQHQFKANLRKKNLIQIKQGKYTDSITKLRTKIREEIKLLESKSKLGVGETNLLKYNKEILKITEPEWIDQKPTYRQPTTTELRQMQALAEAEGNVYDLSKYWSKVRKGEISLTIPTKQGVIPWSGYGTTALTRPVGRRALTEPLWGKKVGITPRVTEQGQLEVTGLTSLGQLSPQELLRRQGIIFKYMQAQETIPKVIYGEDVAKIVEPVPVLAEDTITEIIEEQALKQDEYPAYSPWSYTWHAPHPYRVTKGKPPKETPVKPGGMLLPGIGVSGGAGGGGRGIGYRPGGYKERVHEVPNIWKATASTLERWKKPSEVPRPEWAGSSSPTKKSPTKKSKFFTLKK